MYVRSTRNLVAFHYGNLTHPSMDPPRIGLLSLVPENANSVLEEVVSEAQATGGFESKCRPLLSFTLLLFQLLGL